MPGTAAVEDIWTGAPLLLLDENVLCCMCVGEGCVVQEVYFMSYVALNIHVLIAYFVQCVTV